MSPTLLDEWKNVFATDVQSGIIQCWMFYAGIFKNRFLSLALALTLTLTLTFFFSVIYN